MKIKKWDPNANNGNGDWVQEYPEVNIDNIVATGTPSSTTFLRGDGQWATASTTTTLSDLGVTATAAELNKLDGVTATTAELNYTDGVTSNIQTQLNGKLGSTAKAADSNLLDGIDSGSFLRSDADDTMTKTLTFSTDPIPIQMQENHFINRRFEMIENASPQYILLCRNAASNDVNGRITMDRTSGNYQSVILDVIVTSGSSAMYGGTLKTLQVLQSSEDYRLVSVTYNGTSMIAIKYTGNAYPETTGAYFTGRIVSTGSSMLTVVNNSLITNEASFGGNSEAYYDVDNMVVAGNVSAGGQTLVKTNDSRLSDSRPASDVYSWAKASTKPSYTKSEVGLGNVTNESKATMFTSPALTGTPTAPTATAGTNTTQIATTAFVGTAVSNLVDSSPQTLDTLNELAAALGDDPNFATTVSTNLGNKLDKSGGTITGSLRVDGGVEIGGDLEVVGNSIGFIDTNFDAKIEVSDSNPNGTGAVFNFYGDASSRNATISAEQFDGNAATTTKLLNARNIALTGDVTGSANFDGSANISITATVADDSHNHTIANVDGLQAELDSIPTNNNQLTNGAGYTTNVGDITEVTTSGGLTGGGSSGSVDVSIDTTGATNGEVLTYGPVGPYWSTLADSDNYDGWDLYTDGTSRGRISSGENVDFVGGTDISLSYSSTNNTITISSTASGGSGTVTSVATGGGLTGGTITSSGTISHADTSSQASVNNSGTTFIQDVTLDTYGHVTGLTSSTISNNISGSTFMTAYDPDIGSLLQYGLYGWQTIDVGSQGQVLTVGGSSYNQFSDNDGGWTEIKTGSTQVSGGTGVTGITLSSAIDDTSVIAFELNTSSVLSNTSQIFIVKVENASNTAAGVLFNAYASSTLIRTGSIRVYRGSNTTTLNFSYSYYVNSGSSSEAADTVFVGKIWKLNGRTGA